MYFINLKKKIFFDKIFRNSRSCVVLFFFLNFYKFKTFLFKYGYLSKSNYSRLKITNQ